jgi:hypothetical protein
MKQGLKQSIELCLTLSFPQSFERESSQPVDWIPVSTEMTALLHEHIS